MVRASNAWGLVSIFNEQRPPIQRPDINVQSQYNGCVKRNTPGNREITACLSPLPELNQTDSFSQD